MPGHGHMRHMASTRGVPLLNIALLVFGVLKQGLIWLRLDPYLAESGLKCPVLPILSPKC